MANILRLKEQRLRSGNMVTRQITDQYKSRGTLHSVDLVNRMITLQVNHALLSCDVPIACEILLNDQQVKMHVLQPMDPVVVTYRLNEADCRATRIEVSSADIATARG
jgi:hypothetical protein